MFRREFFFGRDLGATKKNFGAKARQNFFLVAQRPPRAPKGPPGFPGPPKMCAHVRTWENVRTCAHMGRPLARKKFPEAPLARQKIFWPRLWRALRATFRSRANSCGKKNPTFGKLKIQKSICALFFFQNGPREICKKRVRKRGAIFRQNGRHFEFRARQVANLARLGEKKIALVQNWGEFGVRPPRK